MYKIYIVEDDEIISRVLHKHLENWGYDVRSAKDFKNIIFEFSDFMPHIILMDMSLPFFNGYYWCDEIRKISKVPIIFISSASDKMNIILSVEKGGDDYITKPFDINIAAAKIQAMLRRTYEFEQPSELIEHNSVILSLKEMVLIYEGKKQPLSRNEFRIIQLLMENKSKVVSRESITARLWENDYYIDDNTLTVNINRLRKKLSEIGLEDFIMTKKGAGYVVE